MSVCSVQAPDWVDAEECHRCRVQFGVMTRKVGWAFLELGHLEILWFPSFSYSSMCGVYVYSAYAEVDLDLCFFCFSSTIVEPVARFFVASVRLSTPPFRNLV